MPILAKLVGLASLVPFIIVLIKLFQQKGVLHGILGIICALYTFIWGWMNANTLNIKNVMILWTVLIIAGAVLNIMFASSALTTPQLVP
jgi:hypothetical protein